MLFRSIRPTLAPVALFSLWLLGGCASLQPSDSDQAPATAAGQIVNDVTLLNPIPVERVVAPTSAEEVSRLVKNHAGPISIGGARHSMGGQIATQRALFLDMRHMDRVRVFSPVDKTITVEAGVTWRKIQEKIDPHDLSVKIMQTYANFTVGGSLSVNAHGRYVNAGPLINSVRSIGVVLADGSLVEASPEENSEIFYGVIGGYGGLGVIVEATFELEDNQKVERRAERMPVAEYKEYFFSQIQGSETAIFHNADVYPPAYDTAIAITYWETDADVTVKDRLRPVDQSYRLSQLSFGLLGRSRLAKRARAGVIDPLRLRDQPVVWRNYEASYDTRELDPPSPGRDTYVLQEYFVPIDGFDEFRARLAEIFQRYDINVLNLSIRHASKDPGSYLAWANEECFAFVVYYRQGIGRAERTEVGVWTRELIDAALSVNGTYYLPYQIHATDRQFHQAYPRAKELFALKQKLDPTYKFRNKLWDRYLPAEVHDE